MEKVESNPPKTEEVKPTPPKTEQVEPNTPKKEKEFFDDAGNKVSKTQWKRIQKKKKKIAQKKAKKEKRDKETAIRNKKNENQPSKEPEITDPQEYYKNRVAKIQKLKNDKEYFPYPHKWAITHTIAKAIPKFEAEITENGKFHDDKQVSFAGRILKIRWSSKKLIFIDVTAESFKIQVMMNQKMYGNNEDFKRALNIVKRGDIVGVSGAIGRTKKGELTVLATKLKLLSPCLHMLPETRTGLNDQEIRYRQRYLDLMVNPKIKTIFQTRSKVINRLRTKLLERDFMEVETPILNLIAGGATARPFQTYHNDLHLNMSLRVAPELYLKQCIVGGIDRVFEIGKNFRNESIDHTHNPEFTFCELYWAYADYYDLIEMTEEIICDIVMHIKGTLKFDIQDEYGDTKTVDFTRPWKKLSMMEELQNQVGVQLPTDFESPETNAFFDKLCEDKDVECGAPRSTSRLINKLVEHYIEDNIIHPTFLIEQPQIMCPLAKYHRSKPGLTERFELFIDGKEFINAYTELNDPFVQLQLLQKQSQKKSEGDLEANEVDMGFVTALEHALPPTGGWGLGVDRLLMLLTDSYNIQEVILFPAMKPKNAVVAEEGEEVN